LQISRLFPAGRPTRQRRLLRCLSVPISDYRRDLFFLFKAVVADVKRIPGRAVAAVSKEADKLTSTIGQKKKAVESEINKAVGAVTSSLPLPAAAPPAKAPVKPAAPVAKKDPEPQRLNNFFDESASISKPNPVPTGASRGMSHFFPSPF